MLYSDAIILFEASNYDSNIGNFLLSTFNRDGEIIKFIEHCFKEDLKTEKTDTFFRYENVTIKVVSLIYKLHIVQLYVNNIINYVLTKLSLYKHELEINPNRSKKWAKNTLIVNHLIKEIILTLKNTRMPSVLENIFNIGYKETYNRFNDNGFMMIGNLLFLRLLCPAIMTCKKPINIDETRWNIMVRGRTIISKILQNIANNTTEYVKEPFMECMKECTEQNIKDVVENIYTPIISSSLNYVLVIFDVINVNYICAKNVMFKIPISISSPHSNIQIEANIISKEINTLEKVTTYAYKAVMKMYINIKKSKNVSLNSDTWPIIQNICYKQIDILCYHKHPKEWKYKDVELWLDSIGVYKYNSLSVKEYLHRNKEWYKLDYDFICNIWGIHSEEDKAKYTTYLQKILNCTKQ